MWSLLKTAIDEAQELDNALPIKGKESEEEYVWVEGYKGTNENMQGYNDFQFEIGKSYTCDGEPIQCKNGFHFSLKLGDAMRYIKLDNPKNRFFKVKGLVKKEDYKSYGHSLFAVNGPICVNDKLAAKTIILVEEMSNEEIYSMINHDFFTTLDKFIEFKTGSIMIDDFIKISCIKELTGKYSETFIMLLFQNKSTTTILKLKNKALALYDEGVSSDMRAYLLLNGD